MPTVWLPVSMIGLSSCQRCILWGMLLDAVHPGTSHPGQHLGACERSVPAQYTDKD